MKFSLIFLLIIPFLKCDDKFESTLGRLTNNARRNSDIQKEAVENLISRILPNHTKFFDVRIDSSNLKNDKDFFKLESKSNGSTNLIIISGSTGVAAATAFNHYLKYYCKAHISWEISQLNIPEKLPEVNIEIIFNDKFRYYQNVCTTSYSFVWWDWAQWQKHIDWMVMNSFNLVLAFHGQEAIWSEIYKELGLNQDDIDDFFTGPAFLSWLRMGNVQKWGGPLSQQWHARSLKLQKLIVDQLRSFGVITVLPAFAGHLPRAFKRIYPNENMVKLSQWNNFNDTYCCPFFLDPTSELFERLGKMFVEKQISYFGTDNVYSCDSFNENTPPSTDLNYLKNVTSSIFNAMTKADPQAIWLMQNWLFVHDSWYWTKERAKALITAIPIGRMIILDLQSEQFPQYETFDQYFGQPYIWCMLHNFGGTLGMFGNSDIINERPIQARNMENSTMVGTGLTMEGINQNYIIYELMSEMAWRNQPTNLTQWFADYTIRRYGQKNDDLIDAWSILQKTVYNLKTLKRMRGHYATTITPSWNFSTYIWYKIDDLKEISRKFYEAREILKNSESYRHDYVDVLRQGLQVLNDQTYNSLKYSFKKKNLKVFQELAKLFIQLLDNMEDILALCETFSLDEWIKDARNAGSTPEEKDWFEYIARNQITLWGPNGEIMNYALKQWSGVVSDFIQPRWKLFLEYSNETLDNGGIFNHTLINQKMFELVEEPFTFRKMSNSTSKPAGNLLEIIEKNNEKWLKLFEKFDKISEPKDLERIFSPKDSTKNSAIAGEENYDYYKTILK